MARKIPLEKLKYWETTRSKGMPRFLLLFVFRGTPICWMLVYGAFLLGKNLGVQHFGIWLAVPFWISPALMLGLATLIWNDLERNYRNALESQRLEMERAAGRELPPAVIVVQDAPIATWWTCGSPTRVAARITLLAGIVVILSLTVDGLFDGSFVKLPIAMMIALALLLPGTLEGGCRLIRGKRVLIRWRGILVPFVSRRIDYKDISELRIAKGKRPDSWLGKENWCHIAARVGERWILVRRYDYRPEARRFAQALAKELNIAEVQEIS